MDSVIKSLKSRRHKDGRIEIYPRIPNVSSRSLGKIIEENAILRNNGILVLTAKKLTFNDLVPTNEFFLNSDLDSVKAIVRMGMAEEKNKTLSGLINKNIFENQCSTNYQNKEVLGSQTLNTKTKIKEGCHYIYVEINKDCNVYIFDSWRETAFQSFPDLRKYLWQDDAWNDETGKIHFVNCPQQAENVGHCGIFALRNAVIMSRLRLGKSKQDSETSKILQNTTIASYKEKFDGIGECDPNWLQIIELCKKTGKATIGSSICSTTINGIIPKSKEQISKIR